MKNSSEVVASLMKCFIPKLGVCFGEKNMIKFPEGKVNLTFFTKTNP